MKENINKKELKKEGVENYTSTNPNVEKAQIVKYRYGKKYLYQPLLYNKDKKLMVDSNAYWSVDDAKKSIDSYGQ